MIILGALNLSGFAQNDVYKPFKADFEKLCLEKAYYQDSFRLRDTTSKLLLRCENMPVRITCLEENQFHFIVESWNPITDSLEFFARFLLDCKTDYYEFGIDSLKEIDMAILNQTVISRTNADSYGYCAIIALIKTMDYKYLVMLRDAINNAPANSILVWYFDFLVSINVTTTRDWNNTSLGIYNPLLGRKEYKKK